MPIIVEETLPNGERLLTGFRPGFLPEGPPLMIDHFWIKMAAVVAQGIIICTIIFWKPVIWPAMKRRVRKIRQMIDAYLQYCKDNHEKN